MKKAIVPAIILALFAGLGCDLFKVPTNGGDGGGDRQPLTTPRGVIENIQWCYNNRDHLFYEELLDEDNFVFYFDPWDVDHRDVPFSWVYDLEVEATQNLFEAEKVSDISLTLIFEDKHDIEPGPSDTEFRLDGVEYSLSVHVPEEDTVYQADAQANFELSKFEDDLGLMRWWLTIWYDKVTW